MREPQITASFFPWQLPGTYVEVVAVVAVAVVAVAVVVVVAVVTVAVVLVAVDVVAVVVVSMQLRSRCAADGWCWPGRHDGHVLCVVSFGM